MGVDVFRTDEVFRIGVPLNRKEKEPDLLGEAALVGLVGLGLSKELPRGRLGGVVYSAISFLNFHRSSYLICFVSELIKFINFY